MHTVLEGTTQNGAAYTIRYPEASDAHSVWEYVNRLSKERTFVRFQGEVVSLESEEKFVADIVEKIQKHLNVTLFLTVGGNVQGISSIEMQTKTESHVGILGISIDKSIRGQGLGKILMQTVISEACVHLNGLRIITLKLKAANTTALSLYKKLGFKKYGRLPCGTQHREQFMDEILMFKKV